MNEDPLGGKSQQAFCKNVVKKIFSLFKTRKNKIKDGDGDCDGIFIHVYFFVSLRYS